MYAIVSSGGKQHRVEKGQTLTVERLNADQLGDKDFELTPLLVRDGDVTLATPDELKRVSVTAKIIEDVKGPKINGFTYKSKTNNRRRFGHRQQLTKIEITGITR